MILQTGGSAFVLSNQPNFGSGDFIILPIDLLIR